METALSLSLVVLSVVLLGHGAYRSARAYGWVFWAIMGMVVVVVAGVVLLSLAIGVNGWGHTHPGLATAIIITATVAAVAAVAVIGNRLMQQRGAAPGRR